MWPMKSCGPKMNWRNGAEHGRIWRIRRRDAARLPAERRPQLSGAGSDELVESARSSRCVVAKYGSAAARGAAGSIGRAATANAVGRIPIATGSIACDVCAGRARRRSGGRTLALASQYCDRSSLRTSRDCCVAARVIRSRIFGRADRRLRLAAKRDRNTGRRTNASSLRDDLFQMTNDPDSGVRFQLALAIGRCDDPRGTTALATLLDQDDTPWLRLAVLCGIGRESLAADAGTPGGRGPRRGDMRCSSNRRASNSDCKPTRRVWPSAWTG